jgi:hypothetical protein
MNGLITAIAMGSEAHQDALIADRHAADRHTKIPG